MAINYGAPGSEETPISQQNFGVKRNDVADMPPVPAPQFVEGLGMLGPDGGGYVKGAMQRQEYMMNANEDARKEEVLGMAKVKVGQDADYLKIAQEELGIKQADLVIRQNEDKRQETKFGFEVYDKQKQLEIQQGMESAAAQGGYEGVIDYLKTTSPLQAIAFHAEKIKLDNAILGNETMQTIAHQEKGKALLESYGILGKMGQAVLASKPEDRQNLLNNMQPILKQVLGDAAPKTLEEALPMYTLAVAQGTPESQAYGLGKQNAVLNTKLGKTAQALSQLAAQGKTPQNDQLAYDTMEEYKAIQNESQMKIAQKEEMELKKIHMQAQNAKDEVDASNGVMNLNKSLRQMYDDDSKGNRDFFQQRQDFMSAYNHYQKTGSAADQTAMVRTLAMMYAGGKMSDNDAVAFASSDNELQQLRRKFESQYKDSGMVVANPQEIERLKGLIDSLYQDKLPKQKAINERIMKLQKKHNVDEEAINYIPIPQDPKNAPLPLTPVQLRQQLEKNIAKDPSKKDALMQRYNQLMQQQQQQPASENNGQ